MSEKSIDNINNTIIQFYKDSKTGLSITNTFRNLLKAGHKVTLSQVMSIEPSLPTSFKKVVPLVPSTKLQRKERLNGGCAGLCG